MRFSSWTGIAGILLTLSQSARAQAPQYARSIVEELCSETYKGRGYVDDGANKAAAFLESEFQRLKLRMFEGHSYRQTYRFPVNTHPGPVHCSIDGKELQAGRDFLVNPASTSLHSSLRILHFNTRDTLEKELLHKKIAIGFKPGEALALHFASHRRNTLEDSLLQCPAPPAFVIFTEEKKLTHSIATDTGSINSITIFDSLLKHAENINISFSNRFLPASENQNLIGFIKGKRSDSCIVFSAHYDHLGMQGNAMFPGASDNASGCSMILSLAQYYSTRKPPCNIVFMLFSGEEAGLQGSRYFTEHPMFDLQRIKALINIDIMGDAQNGITVVNGEIFPEKFNTLKAINASKKYLPDVFIRGKAKNSDHYYFAEKGVPAFFIYSMGGAGFYHDIFDRPATLSYRNYDGVFNLLLDFVTALNKK